MCRVGGWLRARAIVLLAPLALAPAAGAAAQGTGTTVGILGGVVRNDPRWTPSAPGEPHDGLAVGAFAEAPTPAGWLSIRAEGAYTQRGGDVLLEVGGAPTPAGFRMGYLTAAVHVKLQRSLGPVEMHAVAGPTLDQVLSRRVDAVLAQVFESETPTVLSVGIGVGMGWWSASDVYVGVDARLTEGLGDAHEGNFTSVRNRSWEGLVRVGVPLARLRGG